MNVLILDDEPLFVEQMDVLFQAHFPNWNIYKSYTGTEAIDIVNEQEDKNQSIHLALVDIKLPGRNGLEVAKQLKEKCSRLDVIVISAFQEFEYARRSIKLKAVDYLVKPVLESELLNLLNKYVFENPQYNNKSKVVTSAMNIIMNRYDEQLKLSSVAEELFINPQYLSRLFSEEVEIPFSEYLLRYRIKMAKKLLIKERDWSIDHIALATGFNSQHYFSKAFKKLTSSSPARYRQENSPV